MPERKTIVYTQPGCPACHRETKFLAQKGAECITHNGPAQPNRVVLEPEQLAYPLFVKPYDDFVVYNGGRGGLGVHLDHLLYCIEVGTDIFLDEIDISLR